MGLTLNERIARGDRAQALLRSDFFIETQLAVSEELKKAIVATQPRDAEERERLYYEYHGALAIISRLHRWVADGQMAVEEAERAERS